MATTTAAAIVICHATANPEILGLGPAAFIANFTGAAGAALDNTASGRVTENKFTTPESNNYDDEPVLVFEAPTGSAPALMLPQELQSTGADLFTPPMQTWLAPAAGDISTRKYQIMSGDTTRLESVEIFLRRGPAVHPGTATLNVSGATSYVLDVQAGTIGTAVAIPGLNGTVPVKAIVGIAATGRFFGFKLTGDNVNSVFQYLGAILRGRRVT